MLRWEKCTKNHRDDISVANQCLKTSRERKDFGKAEAKFTKSCGKLQKDGRGCLALRILG